MIKPNVSSSLAPVGDVKVKRLIPDAIIPTRSHPDDAGVDLSCTEDVILAPGERAFVGTGIAVALPVGTVGLVHPRSGLAHKHGLSMVNAPGTIDAGYRGELKVNLINLDPQETIRLPRGSRIAQLVVQRVELCDFIVVDELDETARGAAGHGSTGTDARA